MQILPFIYFAYMFVSFYFLVLTLLVFFKNKKHLFDSPVMTREYGISVIVPAYNEEQSIADTLEHIFNIEYKNLVEVLVINDGSTDQTLDVLKRLLPKYKSKLKILNKKNSGKADSINKALEFAKAELVVVVDADSYPYKDSFLKTVGFFDDPKVGAATITAVPRNRRKFLEKLQVIEYKVIAFTRKLLGYVDSIYVTPGTMAMYRKKALEDIGGFDTTNLTEDIEATWHLIHNGWKIRMSMNTICTTTVPNKIKPWYKQRRRWAVGGLQTINKYRKCVFRRGMLGFFIVPFFAAGIFLGLIGMGILLYVLSKRFLRNYLLAKYSIELGVPVLTMNELLITPSVLNYFGIILFVLFLVFTLFVLSVMKDNVLERQSFFNLLFYMTIYLLIYPVVMVVAIWHLIRGKRKW